MLPSRAIRAVVCPRPESVKDIARNTARQKAFTPTDTLVSLRIFQERVRAGRLLFVFSSMSTVARGRPHGVKRNVG